MSVDPATIVVSGFSSGGCFATQFHTAFSATVAGVGVFSGCPYLSGAVGFNVGTEFPIGSCMWQVEDILVATRQLAAAQAIDPLEELQDDPVYIFQGIQDPIVPWSKPLQLNCWPRQRCPHPLLLLGVHRRRGHRGEE